MELVFPLHSQIRSQACYLIPSDDHLRLVQELDSQVFIAKTTYGPFQTRDALIALLRIRYGGGIAQWHLTEVHGGALVVVPPWLRPDELTKDSDFWERGWDIQMLPWHCIDHPIALPPLTRVRITIWDFPVEYWNIHYFKQVTASMGIIEGFARRHIGGRDKKGATIFLHCADLNLIPYSLTVVFNGGWICCQVDLHGRPPLFGDDQPPPPPPQLLDLPQLTSQGPANTQLPAGSQMASGQRSNTQRWRVRDLARAPAPAASVEGSHASNTTCGSMRIILRWPQKIMRIKGLASDAWHLLSLVSCGGRGNREWPQRIPTNTSLGEPPGNHTLNKKQITQPFPEGHLPRTVMHHNKNPRDRTNGLIHAHKKTSLACHVTHSKGCTTTASHLSQNPKLHQKQVIFHSNQPDHPPTETFHLLYNPLFLSNLPTSTLYHTKQMDPSSKFTDEDEALITKFTRLHTEELEGAIMKVPLAAAPSTCWERCLLLKVISDRLVADSQLASAMLTAWGANPQTTIRQIKRNCFLAEFIRDQDLIRALCRGPWTFRGDLVAPVRVTSHLDLKPENVNFANIWVQFFNLPINCLTFEGSDLLAQPIGTPMSAPVDSFVGGRRFVKLKIEMQLDKPVKDKVTLDHPLLGKLKAHCVYEKVTRICRFCGLMGHEMATCSDLIRMTMLAQTSQGSGRDLTYLLEPKIGVWVTNSSQVPKEGGDSEKQGSESSGSSQSRPRSKVTPGKGVDRVGRWGQLGPNEEMIDSNEVTGRHPIKRPRPAEVNPLALDI